MMILGAQKGCPPWARSPPQIKRRTPQLVNPTQPRRVFSTILFSCASAFVFLQQLHQHCIAWCFPTHLPGMCLVHLLNFKTPKPEKKKHHLPNDRFLIKMLLKNDVFGSSERLPPLSAVPPTNKKTHPPISKPHLASKMAFLFLHMTCHISLASCLLIHLPSLCLCIWLMASMLMLLVLGHCLLLSAFSCKSSSSQSKKKGLCSCNASWDWGCKAWWSGGRFGCSLWYAFVADAPCLLLMYLIRATWSFTCWAKTSFLHLMLVWTRGASGMSIVSLMAFSSSSSSSSSCSFSWTFSFAMLISSSFWCSCLNSASSSLAINYCNELINVNPGLMNHGL